jgi:hypothetical protein
MRRRGLTSWCLLPTIVLAGALIAPSPAEAVAKDKTDPAVDALVASAPSAEAEVHVIVLGDDLGNAEADAGAHLQHKLHAIHGHAVTVKAG